MDTKRKTCAAQSLSCDDLTSISGGMINLNRVPTPPPEQPHGGADTPYWATKGAMRFGAGPWDYGYGSPEGPWS